MDLVHHYPELDFQNGTEGFNLMRGNALQIVGAQETPLLFSTGRGFMNKHCSLTD